MTNDRTPMVLSLQLCPLLSLPEDSHLNEIVQMCVKCCTGKKRQLRSDSLLTPGCWSCITDANFLSCACDEMASNKWPEGADGIQEDIIARGAY